MSNGYYVGKPVITITMDELRKWLDKNGQRFVTSKEWDSYYLDTDSLVDDLIDDLENTQDFGLR